MSYNIHSLIHLPDDCLRFGHLERFSAFPFENFLQTVKRKIKNQNSPLSQFVKRIKEFEMCCNSPKQKSDTRHSIMYNRHYGGVLPQNQLVGNFSEYKQLNHGSWEISLKTPDNIVYLNDLKVVFIKNLIRLESGEHYIIGREFKNKSDLYKYPAPSSYIEVFFSELS